MKARITGRSGARLWYISHLTTNHIVLRYNKAATEKFKIYNGASLGRWPSYIENVQEIIGWWNNMSVAEQNKWKKHVVTLVND